MAYVPSHVADVFISYCHADDFRWIETFQEDLKKALKGKLRAQVPPPEVFFDDHDLRAGRQYDKDLPECLEATGFFVAIVSKRYESSTYCQHKELAKFLRHNPPETGRVIQVRLDAGVDYPLPDALGVEFAESGRAFRAGSLKYQDALRRVFEPMVSALDRLYAQSKMVFLAWGHDPRIEKERDSLRKELEGRGLRVYPEQINEFKGDIRLRNALQESSTSVHFFGSDPDDFAERQLRIAIEMGRPCVVASYNRAEVRRGAGDSPPPIYLDQGNPTSTIANAIDTVLGRGKRDRDLQQALGRTGLFLMFKPGTDRTLGLKLSQRISNTKGPFEVIEPLPSLPAASRYQQLDRARAAVLCWGKADRDWIEAESRALTAEIENRNLIGLKRAVYLTRGEGKTGLDLDCVLQSDKDLDGFLGQLRGAVA